MALESSSSSSAEEDVVIVGAGIAGLATALGLHRLGIRSLVLESAECLRVTGFALGLWTNAWRALDALGIGESIRKKHQRITGFTTTSAISGNATSDASFADIDPQGNLEIRCVIRKVLLETLENELPKGTIRYSSKVVHIETIEGCIKLVHLDDGTILKTKVLIGCDGVNSAVAKYLGFNKPAFTGRLGVRGFTHYEDGHGFGEKMLQFFGSGVRFGVVPCDDRRVYWYFSFSPSPQEKDIEDDPSKLKEFILSKLGKVSDRVREVFERTELTHLVASPLLFRYPWELMWGNISKDNICVAGDALHPMTPDLAQGACSALEDSVVLARVLGEALKEKTTSLNHEISVKEEEQRIKNGLEKYARERRWRSVSLVFTSYMVGFTQQSNSAVIKFFRDKVLAKFLGGLLLKNTAFDCGKLTGV